MDHVRRLEKRQNELETVIRSQQVEMEELRGVLATKREGEMANDPTQIQTFYRTRLKFKISYISLQRSTRSASQRTPSWTQCSTAERE